MQQHHVFLSYSRKDSDLMRRVWDDLRAAGLSVWTDEALEAGTEAWRKAIENAIETSAALVVILSADAKDSVWINRELAYARSRKPPRRVFPLLAKGDEDNAVPIELIDTQRIDIRGETYSAGIKQLVSTLYKLPGIAIPPEKALPFDPNPPISLPITPVVGEKSSPSNPKTVEKPKITKQEDEPIPQDTSLPASKPSPTIVLRELTPWNPRDQLRLLWWLFIRPERLVAYREQFGENAAKRAGSWLASSLTWLPLFITAIGGNLKLVPLTASPLGIPYPLWTGVIILAWLATGWFGYRNDIKTGIVAFGVAVGLALVVADGVAVGVTDGVALGLAGVVALGLALGVAGIVAFGVAVGLALVVADGVAVGMVSVVAGVVVLVVAGVVVGGMALGITGGIRDNLDRKNTSFRSNGILVLLMLSYAALIWIYWLGGWRVFAR